MKYKLSLLFTFLTKSIFAQDNSLVNAVNKSTDSIQETKSVTLYEKGKTYELGGITVTGLQKFSEKAVKVFSGLKVGQEIKLPGDKLSSAIKKLYEQKQFSNVDAYVTKIDGNVAYLEFDVDELPKLNKVTIQGVKKGKAKELQKANDLTKGVMITDNLLVTSENYIRKNLTRNHFL